jgi:hypothetical protein
MLTPYQAGDPPAVLDRRRGRLETGDVEREAASHLDTGAAEQIGDLLLTPPGGMPSVDVDGHAGKPLEPLQAYRNNPSRSFCLAAVRQSGPMLASASGSRTTAARCPPIARATVSTQVRYAAAEGAPPVE